MAIAARSGSRRGRNQPAPQNNHCGDVAHALRQFDAVYAVPGFPVTHLLEEVAAIGVSPIWSASEKTAIEAAVGASICGVACAVVIKHNGLGVALDSLANAVVHGIAASLVVIVGDDVEAESSTSVVDSRELARAAGVLSMAPSLRGDAHSMISQAIASSSRIGAPVLVRITARLHDLCPSPASVPAAPAIPTPTAVRSLTHAHSLTKLSRHARAAQLRTAERLALHASAVDQVHCSDPHGPLVVAVGDVEYPNLGQCIAMVRSDSPAEEVIAAAQLHKTILVVEEGAPIIENALRGAVRGRGSGHLPWYGRITSNMVADALADRRSRTEDLAIRPTTDRSDHRRPLFAAIARHAREGVFVATDVGSSIALAYGPFFAADAALALGSAPAVASGAARTGRGAIAVVGDYALLHSGVTGQVDIAASDLPVLTIVIDNGVQAKTGGQPLPQIDIGQLIESGVLGRVADWSDVESDQESLYLAIAAELASGQPVIVRYWTKP